MNDNELARIRNEEIGFVFQTFNLLPRATALHNVELPLVYAGVPAKDRQERAKAALEKVELDAAHDAPAERAVRRPAPARRHRPRARQQPVDPARRRADRQPRLEDRRRDHGAVRHGCTQAGNTIILVTHEADIAAYAHRVIPIRDGQVERDVEASHARSLGASRAQAGFASTASSSFWARLLGSRGPGRVSAARTRLREFRGDPTASAPEGMELPTPRSSTIRTGCR